MAADIFSFIQPMMALPVRDLPTGNWIYEIKFDGYRALAIKADKGVRLISRNRKSFNDDYPVLIDSLNSLKTKSFAIDGEITALDENGRSCFQLLQGYGKAKHTPLVYYAFDLLSLDSADLRSRPLTQRRKLLAKLLEKAPGNIKFSEELTGTKEELLRVADRRREPLARLEVRMDSAFFSDAMVQCLEKLGVEYTISVPFERFVLLKERIEKRILWCEALVENRGRMKRFSARSRMERRVVHQLR